MPWEETNVMEQREEFIKEMLKQDRPFKHLCEQYGISEKTGYKWKNRYYEEGKRGLMEQSRAPLSSPTSLNEDIVIALLALKNAHPYWGAKKVLACYNKAHSQSVSLSSVNRILNKAGLTKKRKIHTAVPDPKRSTQRIPANAPNDVWAIDFKGWWCSDGERCEPFTVRDLYSRKLLCAELMTSRSAPAIRAVMTRLFKRYGLPKVIRSDNGTPFVAAHGILKITTLSAWWITLGIIPDRTDKGKPGQNGSLERLHADIAREIQGHIPGGRVANQVALDLWRDEYNSVRPNEAIDFRVPDDLYSPSPRKYTGDFDSIEYPPGFTTRKVFGGGEIMLSNIRVTIGYSLRGLHVGLKPLDNSSFEVFLADFPIGILDMVSCCFSPSQGLS